MRVISRAMRALRPELLQDVRQGLKFGADHHLTSGRFAQARYWRHVQSFGLDLLPPIPLADALIVDAGANVGDFTAVVLAVEPSARVLAIEPAPPAHELLAARFGGDRRVRLDRHAITDAAGTTTLNLTEYSVLASLLPPRNAVDDEYGTGARVTAQIEVPTLPLDDLVDQPVAVLKIDVQGGEPALLRGAERTLAQTRAVLIEVMFVSHYEGDTTFPGLHRMMEERGWVLRAMASPHRGAGAAALFADACYVPAP